MEKLKTGIIGTGKVGHLHATALTELPESEFTAVCNVNFKGAQAFAEQYRVKAYADVEDMVAGGVQAVTVCTPHPLHAGPTIKAARAGAHVIVEKPLASSLADCDAMIRAAKEARVKLAMISQRRLYAPVQRIKKAIEDHKLGQPILGTVNMLGWRDQAYYQSNAWRGTWLGEGGGVLVNQAPHQLDILQWFLGPIDQLFGCWANLNHPYIEVEDTAAAIIRFKNGALGNILVSNSLNPALYGKVAVHGSSGASVGVQTDGGAMFIAGMSNITEPPINDLWKIPGEEGLLESWQQEDTAFFQSIDPTRYYHQLQIQDFLQAILEDRDPMMPGEEGQKTVELFTAIYRSQRDNRVVPFPLVPETDRTDLDGRLTAASAESSVWSPAERRRM
ncbi:MAG: Gfo/Idh/MocA family oxidoreductase [Acidobacteria bacterium]|nr:Gfo/Idh/MocA family oxidoreductase [Acidobacteriota bacterium]MCI0719491.1 Gfo/Idh/MocA family oxidoreductase [Acidobacteriota bacterium]